jgi:putative transposase
VTPALAARPTPQPPPAKTSCLRHVRTRVRSPQTNGVIERFFGTLKYEHLFRGPINDGDALAVEVARFRQIYNTIRPHQAIGDRTPRDAYLAGC